MSLRRVRPVVLLAALVLLVSSLAVRTHFRTASASDSDLAGRFDPYLHRPGTGDLADPVNLVFRGGTPQQAAQAVEQVLGWTVTQGGDMTFTDAGQLHPTAVQIGSDLGWGARLHMRIEGATSADGQGYVLAGVHRDDMYGCGHIGHYFSEARDTVARGFAADGYTVTYLPLKNTAPGPQCNGTQTAGDGVAAIIDLASSTPPAQPPVLPAGHLLPPINLGDFIGL